jgi:hypothetical protein
MSTFNYKFVVNDNFVCLSVHEQFNLEDSFLGGILIVILVRESSLDSFGPLSNGSHGGEEPAVTEYSLVDGSWSDSMISPEFWLVPKPIKFIWSFPRVFGSIIKFISQVSLIPL